MTDTRALMDAYKTAYKTSQGAKLEEQHKRLRDWAVQYNLTRSSASKRCLHWLRRESCQDRNGERLECREGWMDHLTHWIYAGRRAVLLSQPYGLDGKAQAQLDAVMRDLTLEVRLFDSGWYGGSTSSIEVWDRSAWNLASSHPG